MTLKYIILRAVRVNQRKYGHTKTLPFNTIKLFVERNVSIKIISTNILHCGLMVMKNCLRKIVNITILY